jgi:hypothetical protein
MGITTIGPSGLDPFIPAGPPPEETREAAPDNEVREKAPLPENTGTQVDTSA